MAKKVKHHRRLHHFFIPHPETHKKAHLLSFKALIVYVLFFVMLQFGLNGVSKVQPGVLGVSADLNEQDLIKLTNVERQKAGLPPVTEDPRLAKAAEEKAKNMFAENYWAHYSPSGKSPWEFISNSGYKYSYAGENLARNFYTSKDVVDAWMASKMGHKENLLNPKYQNIGMAVMEGQLNGKKTMLVVQEFGTPVDYVANKPTIDDNTTKTAALENKSNILTEIPVNAVPKEVKSVTSQTLTSTSNFQFDPYALMKTLGFALISFLGLLILLDFIIIWNRRKAIINLYTRHVPHLALLPIASGLLMNLGPGSIL